MLDGVFFMFFPFPPGELHPFPFRVGLREPRGWRGAAMRGPNPRRPRATSGSPPDAPPGSGWGSVDF